MSIVHATETEELWRELHGRLLRFVRGRVASREDAEDIVQEVFTRIHERAHLLGELESVSGWVYRVTRNAVADHHRRRAAAEKAAKTAELEAAAEPSDDPENGPPDEGLARCLQPLVRILPERYGRALELTELSGLTQHQAAARLGISLSGVKSRVSRGRRKLKDLLLDCCHVELDRRRGVAGYEPRQGCCRGNC